MNKIGQELLRFALVVFVLIPALIAGLNNAEANLMRQMQQMGQPRPALAPPPSPYGMQTALPPQR